MSPDRLETNGSIIGDTPFGLVEKDARFARWDARKNLRWSGDDPQTRRRANLFEGTDNDTLLDRMRQLHGSIAEMERSDLDEHQILERLLTDTPDLSDYNLLFRKAAWGERLIKSLHRETYGQDENGVLWRDFVMNRIHRTLGGQLSKLPRYDGRFSYQIDTPQDVLRFDPESNAHANDGPEFHIRGNRKAKERDSGWDTDQRFKIDIQNITEVQVCESGGTIKVIKDMGENKLHLICRQKPVGSTHQIEAQLVTK
ncbi:MAG: hypothetical protein Q7T54_04450 [Candidatus Levybacteria bacterium]|nr:hypothetical protein [Candidatus Levybacteria bacterium]